MTLMSYWVQQISTYAMQINQPHEMTISGDLVKFIKRRYKSFFLFLSVGLTVSLDCFAVCDDIKFQAAKGLKLGP